MLYRQRPYSIRTRIKTRDGRDQEVGEGVRDHIPLEQGLRPMQTRSGYYAAARSETIFH